jgi:hypothetical protein
MVIGIGAPYFFAVFESSLDVFQSLSNLNEN